MTSDDSLDGLSLRPSSQVLCEGGWWRARLCARRWREAEAGARDEDRRMDVDVEIVGNGVTKSTEHTKLRPCSLATWSLASVS